MRYALRTFFGFTLIVTAWVVLGYSIGEARRGPRGRPVPGSP